MGFVIGELGVEVSEKIGFLSYPQRPDGSKAHPASYSMGIGGFSPGAKAIGE
jgi:hypothetical protein